MEEIFNNWPEVEKKYLVKDVINIVIQFNGKKRDVIECKKDINEKELTKIIKEKSEIKKYFDNKKILRTIYVKNKIINFII